ncbi:hypothetical protein FE257_000785 [Aspergillus nanangensis]|uniref:Uncharacterized protein n=1 Tax=Aspergillus nanangensis TaxID=2582783 RepID=A0AAD4CEM5_ASPNN|nr:hypothetical protein FE257_000785 [Aspergillus nanangensis]
MSDYNGSSAGVQSPVAGIWHILKAPRFCSENYTRVLIADPDSQPLSSTSLISDAVIRGPLRNATLDREEKSIDMVRMFSVLALALLAMTPAEAARVHQPGNHHQASPMKRAAVESGFQGRFATGGPHSVQGRQVTTSPKIKNQAKWVRVGKKHDLTIGLERPYEALFGHVGVNKHNYRNVTYGSLKV